MTEIEVPRLYHVSQFGLDRTAIVECHRLDNKRPVVAIAATWIQIVCLIEGLLHLLPGQYFWWGYLPVIFLIAGRQGALLQFVHEATHSLLASSKAVNSFIGGWLAALPIGVSFPGYARGHLRHHAHTGTADDLPSDVDKYRIVNLRDPKLYLLFLKDMSGLSALSVFFGYLQTGNDDNAKRRPGENFFWQRWLPLGQLCFVQTVLLGALFQFNVFNYILLWILPAVSAHMVLMRVRGIAEHGLAKQLRFTTERPEDGNFYTRSFGTPQNRYGFLPFVWLERALIGSLNVYYHHEHHLFPRVPFYRLPKLHKILAGHVAARNPDVYAKGYLAAFARGLAQQPAADSNAR